ncbi:MAG: GNAT family protein, partial [Acidimicrobiia bacterium]
AVNEFGQPIGASLGNWAPPPFPAALSLSGHHVVLEPLRPDHAAMLFPVLSTASDSLWTYMAIGPFRNEYEMRIGFEALIDQADWLPYAIFVGGTPCGFLSYLRIDPPVGVIEIGSIVFAPVMQRTTAATEAIYLLVKHVFDLGYRRCEWKCDDLNEPSRVAAERLGFRYEGTFKKATHYKGRNRDTAWYAITDEEWPMVAEAFEGWLAPGNFDTEGQQRKSLQAFRH